MEKITEAVFDPKWSCGVITMGLLPFITVEHPRHGPLTFCLTTESIRSLAEALNKLISE